MGLRGPQPKPTAIKVAAGNPGRRQLNENEPIPPAGEVSPPPWLRDQALQIWNHLAPVLVQMRTLTTADVLAFGRYCQMFARYLELDAFLMARGPSGTTFTSKGSDNKVKYVHELPQAAEYRRLVEQLIRHEDRFGMSPAARTRLHVQLASAAPAALTAQQLADQQKRDFFATGGPMPPQVLRTDHEDKPSAKKAAKPRREKRIVASKEDEPRPPDSAAGTAAG